MTTCLQRACSPPLIFGTANSFTYSDVPFSITRMSRCSILFRFVRIPQTKAHALHVVGPFVIEACKNFQDLNLLAGARIEAAMASRSAIRRESTRNRRRVVAWAREGW